MEKVNEEKIREISDDIRRSTKGQEALKEDERKAKLVADEAVKAAPAPEEPEDEELVDEAEIIDETETADEPEDTAEPKAEEPEDTEEPEEPKEDEPKEDEPKEDEPEEPMELDSAEVTFEEEPKKTSDDDTPAAGESRFAGRDRHQRRFQGRQLRRLE